MSTAQLIQTTCTYAIDALREAVLCLQKAHVETASLDARILLEHVLGMTREELLADAGLMLDDEQAAHYHHLVERRADREPVAKLIGRREFWGREFIVSKHTLDPRPDSETLIEAVLDHYRDRQVPLSLLDLGTGSGCLLLTLLAELPQSRGVAVDICGEALAIAKQNALRLGLEPRVTMLCSRWAEKVSGQFDIIISNPPYIPSEAIGRLAPEVASYEPKLALDGGEDGLDCYREVISQLPALLAPAGLAALEVGISQDKVVQAIAEAHGLQIAGIRNDLGGIARCVLIRHKATSEQ